MRKNMTRLGLMQVVIALTFFTFIVPGPAQPDEQPTTDVRLKVQHVRAAMMFWWLTGEKDKQEKNYGSLDIRAANTLHGLLKPTIPLQGLRKLAFDSATNELLASGTPEGVRELRDALEFLDRPIRKVEFQVQAIEIDRAYVEQAKWFSKDSPSATIHNDKPTGYSPKILPEQIPQIVITGYRAEQFQLFLNSAREQKLIGDIQTYRIEVLNNFKTKLSVEENALTLGWELALTPTIQNDGTVTLFCTPQLKGQMITTVANMRPKDTAMLQVRKLEQAGRVMIFMITVNSITPQSQ